MARRRNGVVVRHGAGQRGRPFGASARRVSMLVVATLVAAGVIAVAPATSDALPGAPVADEFSGGTLDTQLWSVVDPLGDSTVSLTGGALSIAVPGGTPHDMWTPALDAPRVMQQVADADFEVEAKFDSSVSAHYQLQGLVAEDASGRMVRFDTYSNGSAQMLFAATFVGTSPTARLNAALPSTTPIHLRLQRADDTWTLRWSADGESWNIAATFSFPMTVDSVGVFAGNASTPAPAFTAVVDYFRPVVDDATPPVISAASASAETDTATITWTTDEPASSEVEFGVTTGYGQSAGTADLATSHEVVLSGLSCETEYHFRPVSTDAAGNSSFGDDGVFTTGTCPPPDTVAPTIANVAAQTTSSGAVVSWTTDEPARSRVDYGATASYGQVAEAAGSDTTHTVTISGLSCNSSYHFRPVSSDAAGNTALGTDATFTTADCQEGVVSDEFPGPALDTSVWSLTDPVGDATVGVEEGQLRMGVPAGVSHDFWTPVRAPRLLQETDDIDITVEAKFDSPVDDQYQLQGLVAEDASGRLLRFDTYSNGSTQQLFIATFVDGSPTVRLSTTIPTTAPIYLRLDRTGDTWTAEWSADGTTWNLATTFAFAMTMSKIGLFVGNAGPSPSMTAHVDYFRAGDQPAPGLTIAGVEAVPASDAADVTWTTNQPADSRVDYGTTTAYGQTVQDPALVTSHGATLSGLTCGTTYHFRVTSTDAADATATSPDGTFTTTACSPPPGDPGDIVSDDFSGPALDTELWTVVGPKGDGVITPTGTNLAMLVPRGTTHDMWTGPNTGLRLRQSSLDTDFEIEVKFESPLELDRQTRGLIIEQDASTFLRFDESFSGTSHRLFAATITGTSATTRVNTTIPAGDDMLLRIGREGDTWTLRYSGNGSDWVTAATFTFAMTVSGVGPYVGNGLGPAAVASVDYFSNLAAPVTNDDGGAPPSTTPGPAYDVWYGDTQNVGARDFGQQWVDVAGTVDDPDGVGQLWYTVNGSPARLLSVGPDTRRLHDPGDFVAEIDHDELVAGANQVVLYAFDQRGDRSSRTVTINNLAGPVPPLPDTVTWSGANSILDVAQVVDGKWVIEGDVVRTTQVGYDRLVAIGSTEWPAGYEVTVPITIHSQTSGGVGVLTGWTGHTGTLQPRVGHPYGALAWFRQNQLELVDTNAVVSTSTPRVLTVGTEYTFKVRAEPQGGGMSIYRFKVWETGTPEPTGWDLTTTLPTRAGSAVLVAHYTDASFGTVETVPLDP